MQSKQEQAFNKIAETFLKLIARDKRIEHKKEVQAFWHDFFEHEGIRNNMIQAINNLLWDLNAEYQQNLKTELENLAKIIPRVADADDENTQKILHTINKFASELDDSNIDYQQPEELLDEVGDLREIGGGDEDDTPLI